MTEKEKMIAGKLYDSDDKELQELRVVASDICCSFNALSISSKERLPLLNKLLGSLGKNSILRGPIYFDYGFNTYIGDGSYVNFNFACLDVCPVRIGKNVFIANNVSIVTATHPLIAEERMSKYDEVKGYSHDLEYGKPVTIKDNVWIGANVSIGPGVTIGKNSVIGMGSNVVKDIPEGVVAFGNPCRPIRKITEKDSVKYKKELFVEGD